MNSVAAANCADAVENESAGGWATRTWLLAAILALCIARLWLAPLPSSFWVDEMGTAFVVQHGAGHPSFQAAPQVPMSVYYRLPQMAQSLFGPSEVAYRIPSVLCMAAALLLIGWIARRLIHPDAGWFAVFACLLLREFNYQAADARPYALGTCMVCACLFFLIRWLDHGRWLDALAFMAAASLLWRVHLLFWPLYLVFGIYTATRQLRRKSAAGWLQVAGIYLLLAASLLPVVGEAISLGRQAGAHVVAPVPSGSDLTKALKLDYVMPFCVVAALLSRWQGWPRVPAAAAGESLTLIFSWWLCDPFSLYEFSRLTGDSVFLSRYLYLALPGVALSATLAAAWFLPRRYWKMAGAVLGVGVLITQGHWNRLWPAHHNSDWRNAARTINAELSGAAKPVLCPSPFIEARPPVWRPDYPLVSFLYSHLVRYPVHGRVYPFPFETSPDAVRYAAELSSRVLSPSQKFIIYGGDRAVLFWRGWFAARPELAGWRIRPLGSFGDVVVLVFEKGT